MDKESQLQLGRALIWIGGNIELIIKIIVAAFGATFVIIHGWGGRTIKDLPLRSGQNDSVAWNTSERARALDNPTTHETTMVLMTLESLHAELQRMHKGKSVESLPDRLGEAMGVLGEWLARWDEPDPSMSICLHRGGGSLEPLRSLLSAHVHSEFTGEDGQTIATGLERRATVRRGAFARIVSWIDAADWKWQLARQARHLERVIVRLRDIEEALHRGSAPPAATGQAPLTP